jgi:hypothetical protein
MAVRLSALRADRPLLPGRFLVLISVRGGVDARVIVRLEGLGQLKNPITSSGIKPATFREYNELKTNNMFIFTRTEDGNAASPKGLLFGYKVGSNEKCHMKLLSVEMPYSPE